MKKLTTLILALTVIISVKAQWVNNPANNTFIANTSADAGEIYLATNHNTGDTYMQWSSFVGGNGWSPTLQRLNFEGVPQWGPDGIHIAGHQFASYSQGFAMATTTDGGVVSCFAADDDHSYAVKINPDGTFPWGEQGVQLFDGLGFSRVELIATDDDGIWALGFDYNNLYLQYANEALSPVITISDNGGKHCMFGQLTLGTDNKVFVTYEKCGNGNYTEKEIYVAGYNTDGTQFSPETLLMASKTFQVTYIHQAISDGMGGGYVYIWHSGGIGSTFNVYVFHFNQNGANTFPNTEGVTVHSLDMSNFYIGASATVDPDSHDIILVYEQTDQQYQTQCKIFINRITSTGYKMWDDGYLVLDNGTVPCGGYRIDAFEYGGGFSVIYHKGLALNSMQSTVEAHGFDMDHKILWNTTMCSTPYNKTGDQNSAGFYGGQNIVAWVNAETGGLYGQNIGWDGEMGDVTPPTPPTPCYAPTNFNGFYSYDSQCNSFGAILTWDAPETTPLHYMLYREDLNTSTTENITIYPEFTDYFDNVEIGDYIYRLTAVYEDCESDYAMTANGDDYVLIEVTSVPENQYEAIVSVIEIYNVNGQRVNSNNINDLHQGIYIVKGVTESGKTVIRKIVK